MADSNLWGLNNQDSVQSDLHRSAQAYNKSRGMPPIKGDMSSIVIPHAAHHKMGEHLNAQPEWDNRPQVAASYKALEDDTWRQFDHMTKPRSKGGMGLDANVRPHDPYGRSNNDVQFADKWQNIMPEAAHDIGHGNIQALSTQSTGGTPNFKHPDTNDAFRLVHDTYGHVAAGRGVDRQGEEAAYQHHRQMFSPEARPALANQLREQIGYMQRYKQFPGLKHALGHDSGPINPTQFGEKYSDLKGEADAKSREQGLL